MCVYLNIDTSGIMSNILLKCFNYHNIDNVYVNSYKSFIKCIMMYILK